ncbi:MAG: tetratricopeptide repeat protein [Bryobacteraceae bacterium]|nr:tetratricopeptide repeat protein [Bryobacteraceae bacterium]
MSLVQIAAVLLIVLALNTAYITAFAEPTVLYMGNVLIHIVLGTFSALFFLWVMRRSNWFIRVSCAAALLAGLWLAKYGNTFPHRPVLWIHALLGLAFILSAVQWLRRALPAAAYRHALALATAAMVVFPLLVWSWKELRPDPRQRIRNSAVVPVSMEEEGAGPKSPFWPSAANTNTSGKIPADFFMDSKLCGECHKDIYQQWNSSMHHFASFNNQFYRKSIEYMQSVSGTKSSKWCAGCHDHALFFNGRFDQPVKDQIDTPEAQNGLGCVSCHSISHVEGTTGNGGFTIEYPPLHSLASSRNPYIRALDNFLTYADPEPHRKTFLKPFMRLDNSEFCSSCHKVHLDVPVNNYRWIRGFNDYDNWQASGVSGQGARSFYYPKESQTCGGCHMPMVPSTDPGNRDGKVHSHRFAAANTAVAAVNGDKEQLDATIKNLKSGFISVDIFAASPVTSTGADTAMVRRKSEGPQLASTFAIGEEAEQSGAGILREVGNVSAPLDRTATKFEPGSTVRVDVVVRTKKIGHFFPGGTVDAFDIWLELVATDADQRTIYWSGRAEDDGKGPVEQGAHFYRSYQLDGEGNPINKRNAWQTRSVLYVRLIPPGAADVAHYRVKIPSDVKGPVSLQAKLNYRKFSHYYTQFSYAGEPEPGQLPGLVSLSHDSRKFGFSPANIPANVSGGVKGQIPDLPTVVLAEAKALLPLSGDKSSPVWNPVLKKQDRERWNDWGIGMLLQGDLKGAEYAFTRVTEADPGYADGWLNVARALIQEGEVERAKPFLEKALAIDSSLGRIHFFKAAVQKADGDYDGALRSLRTVEAKYPRDRVVLNQIGRILFLKRDYASAVESLQKVLQVDPEDVQAHYTLMLCYRGLGQADKAAREEKLFRRFKADESSQSITARQRLQSPEDNNERQMIHDHESVAIPARAPSPIRSAVPGRAVRAAMRSAEPGGSH